MHLISSEQGPETQEVRLQRQSSSSLCPPCSLSDFHLRSVPSVSASRTFQRVHLLHCNLCIQNAPSFLFLFLELNPLPSMLSHRKKFPSIWLIYFQEPSDNYTVSSPCSNFLHLFTQSLPLDPNNLIIFSCGLYFTNLQ